MNDVDRRAALAEADLLHELGRTVEALDALTPALNAHPHDAQVLSLASVCHLSADGDAVEALTLARRASISAPAADLPHRLAALAYLRLNQKPQARAEAADAVALAPTSWATHFVLGTAHLGDVRTRRCAIDAARRAVAFAPDRWEAHQLLARAYLDGGSEPSAVEVDAAVLAIEEALRLNPGAAELRHDLARAHFQRGWTTRALAEFSGASIYSAARTESVRALSACLAVLARTAAVALTAAALVVLVLLLFGTHAATDTADPAATDPWAAGLVIVVAVAVALSGLRVVAALRRGARGLWSGIVRTDGWLVVALTALSVAASFQLLAVALPGGPARVVMYAAVVLLIAAWASLVARVYGAGPGRQVRARRLRARPSA